MLNENFFYAGLNALSNGICLQKPITFTGAEPDVETIHVPGRNGDLSIYTGAYKNRKGTAECYCIRGYHQRDVEQVVTMATAMLLGKKGYNRLECTNDPTHYWMAKVVNGPQIEDRLRTLNPFTVEFDCMPQRFLKSGETAVRVTNGGTILNPTAFPALPLIHIKGTGAGRLQIGKYVVEVKSLDEDITLDSNTQNAYSGTTNLNSTISAPEFPELMAGLNEISFTGNWTVELIPRWWTL